MIFFGHRSLKGRHGQFYGPKWVHGISIYIQMAMHLRCVKSSGKKLDIHLSHELCLTSDNVIDKSRGSQSIKSRSILCLVTTFLSVGNTFIGS